MSKIEPPKYKILNTLNKKGIPIPLLRDPKTGVGSVSLTMSFIAFNIWILALSGLTSAFLGGLDIDAAFNMTLACFSLYFGRNIAIGNKSSTITEAESAPEETKCESCGKDL